MTLGKKKKTISADDIYLLSYGIYLFVMQLWQSFYAVYFERYLNIIIYLCIFLLIIKEFTKSKVSIKELIILSVFFLLAIGAKNTQSAVFLYLLIFVFSGRNVKFEKIAKVTISISIGVLLLVVLSSHIGLIENYATVSSDRHREYLGFRYALYGPGIFINALMLEIYIKKEKIKYIELVMWLLFSYYLFHFTDARLSFLLSLIVLLIAMILKKKPDFLYNDHIISFTLCLSYIFGAVLSFYSVIAYARGATWARTANELLGGRIMMGQRALGLYGVPIWGRPIDWIGNGLDVQGAKTIGSYMYVDNMYIQLAVNYGIIFFILIVAVFTLTEFAARKRKNIYLLIMLSVLAVHFLIDDLTLRLFYNTFWFATVQIWREEKSNILYKRKRKRISLKRMM